MAHFYVQTDIMAYNDNIQKIDNVKSGLVELYNDNIYPNQNNEINADMVNECFSSTSDNICSLIKEFLGLKCKIKAYRNYTLSRDESNVNKSYITASLDQGWLVRVDIPAFINFFHYGDFTEESGLHSILTPTSGLANWDETPEGFAVYAVTYQNKTWNQGDIWFYERELDINNNTEAYTLLFFVEQVSNNAMIPDLGIGDQNEYYWEDGPAPLSFMTAITHPAQAEVFIDFDLKGILAEIYNEVF